MKTITELKAITLLSFIMLLSMGLQAQEADNAFTIDAKFMSRGEVRYGGFKPDSIDNQRSARFILGQYRLNLDYQRSWLEIRLSPQQSVVWGQAGGSLSIYEAWALMRSRKGFFAQIGRQKLEYDNERILGYDDWTMTAPTHDVLRFGYEGAQHKLHLIVAYNQNPDNPDIGQTYYSDGLQPNKSMQTLWYHYDTPKNNFGISLLAMNIGMQNDDKENPKTYFQQLVGTYMNWRPKHWSFEGEFYYQMGKEEHGIPLSAFMGGIKAEFSPNDNYMLYSGYDYLSGDKYFAISPELGYPIHEKIRGFNAIYGSHHEFYGAMDFFYVDSYQDGLTPGLQNLYLGTSVNPTKKWNFDVACHYYAITSDIKILKTKTLGYEVDFSTEYDFTKYLSLSAGYSFMYGTETMEVLQHVDENRRLHWGWLMLVITPEFFTTTWQDKK